MAAYAVPPVRLHVYDRGPFIVPQNRPVIGPGKDIGGHDGHLAPSSREIHNKGGHGQSGRMAPERLHDLNAPAERSAEM